MFAAPINRPPRSHAWKAIGLTTEGRMISAMIGIRVPIVSAGGAPIVLIVLMVQIAGCMDRHPDSMTRRRRWIIQTCDLAGSFAISLGVTSVRIRDVIVVTHLVPAIAGQWISTMAPVHALNSVVSVRRERRNINSATLTAVRSFETLRQWPVARDRRWSARESAMISGTIALLGSRGRTIAAMHVPMAPFNRCLSNET
jgi:hypothetical protein